jgi:O-acetylserine/cysteine efflux transporter
MPLGPSLLACLTATIWGINFVVIDEGIGHVPPLTFAAIRFTVVAIPAIFFVRRPAARAVDIARVGLFMSVGQFGLLYTALQLGMPPGLASLVLQAQVILTVLIAMVRLGEHPRRSTVIGILIGTVGLAIVALGRSSATPALGLVLTLGAALSWALGNVAARRIQSASGLSLTVWSATVVPLPLFAMSLLLDGPQRVTQSILHLPTSAILSTAYTAYLASLVGYGIWNTLLARYPAGLVAPFALLVPPVGIAAAWVVQGESPGPAEVVGGAILLAGVVVTTLSRRPPLLDQRHDLEDADQPDHDVRRPGRDIRHGAGRHPARRPADARVRAFGAEGRWQDLRDASP